MSKTINCCLVGDSGVGKTCLVESYTSGSFPRSYIPTILDVYSALVNVGDDSITLRIFDLSGLKENVNYRKEIMKNCDVVILCYAMTSVQSLQSIENYWISEIEEIQSPIQVVLAGTQSDLLNFKKHEFEPIEFKAKELGKKLGIESCLECSSLTQNGVKNVFDQAIIECFKKSNESETLSKKKCVVM